MYLIDALRAAPQAVAGTEGCWFLEWPARGGAIYFGLEPRAIPEIWKIAPEGGEAVLVSRGAGGPVVSSDGRFLYYTRRGAALGENHLWRTPRGGGPEEKVLEYVDAYSLGEAGIAFKYFPPGPQHAGPYLEFYRFGTGTTQRLLTPRQPLRYGIALSPDGRYLLHAQTDYEVSDLMLVEGFR